jgi:lipopolysaccharide/colanic/teichoic acid biosynthesis glycosyltransferase
MIPQAIPAVQQIKKAPRQNESILYKIIATEAGKGVAKFVTEQVDLDKRGVVLLSALGKHASIGTLEGRTRTFIDLETFNSQPQDLNVFFRSVNDQLPDAGIYIGCLESNSVRKERIFRKFPKQLAHLLWAYDFIVNRVLPKLSYTKGLYHFLFPKKKHVLSKAEALGRLTYAGFAIIGHELINNRFYFSVIKVNVPKFEHKPSGGLLFKMPRISKGGEIIGVYKVRTMHPYSEYLQDYVVKMNGYNLVGKPNKDFRLTRWGKVIRKLHLDELPQVLNILKGDLKIVGVRPISKFGFDSLPADLQRERIKYKTGCIPPNVSLGMTGFDGVVKAERIYLSELKKHGSIINIKYFWMAMFNIILRKEESA